MRYPASETAEKHVRILDAAARLFRERGSAGVSVSEIMQATGLTHGAMENNPSLRDGDTVYVPEGHKIDFGLFWQAIASTWRFW